MNAFKSFLVCLALSLLYNFSGYGQEPALTGHNCFSILVGREASVDGSVLFAHNEDDYGDRLVNWYKVPSMTHTGEELILLKNGGTLPQVQKTWSYLWLEMPEMEFSDSYMNEWGVTISSDQCLSREKKPELTDGGIGYWLRRAMAERARTAREAVKIGGALVEHYGYSSSGRTYCIADPREAWMMAVVSGKHWVAKRVPDDEAAIIPNYFTISTVDLSDTMNYYGSADIIEYAVTNNWYNPDKNSVFNFREAYADPESLKNMGNLIRHCSAINLISDEDYGIGEEFPFSFKPEEKLNPERLFEVLRNHNEGTEFDKSEGYTKGNPHEFDRGICANTTQYGFVAQLRSNIPAEIGAVMWLAPFRPCVHPFTQWYFGVTDFPENLAVGGYKLALTDHFEPIELLSKFAPDHLFLEFVKHAKSIDKSYGKLINQIRPELARFEQEITESQASFEKRVVEIYNIDPREARKLIDDRVHDQLEKSLELIR